jgi:malonyl CoA-acyl carrier protein transacylase/NAD(P)-dependent dehydrogenase (short-subunit alcohol dehydrogenase family)
MWPRAAFSDDDREGQRRQLAHTAVAQPAIGAMSGGLMDVMRRLRLTPTAVAGHSFGEFVALHAAGCLDRDSLFALSAARGRAMASVGADAGMMAMIARSDVEVLPFLEGVPDVVIANRNAPQQVVISGSESGVRRVIDRIRSEGHTASLLPVSGAFHSPLMRPARAALDKAIASTVFRPAAVPVHANVNGQPYPTEPSAIAARLQAHLEQPVDFVAQVEAMYAAGVRTFVELGPGRVLTGLVRRTLGNRPHRAMSADGGLRSLLEVIASLHVSGHPADVPALFEGRPVRWIDLDRLPDLPALAPGWWVDGGRVWADGDTSQASGLAPFLDADSPTAPAPMPLAFPGAGVALTEFYRQYEETMRRFLDQQDRMLDHVLGLAPGGEQPRRADRPTTFAHAVPAAPALPASITPPARATPDRFDVAATDRDSLVGRLVRIVGDRTGYATEAIGVDLDLEADLGIDSIKRVEIIATFANSLAEPDARRLQAELDRLTRLRTLNAIGAASATALARAHEPEPVSSSVGAECPRFVMRSVEEPSDGSPTRRLSGLHLVTAGGHDISPHVIEALTRHGAEVGEIAIRDLLDGARLSARLARLREQCGPVRGVIHLAPIGRPPAGGGDGWRVELDATTLSLFAVLKSVMADLTAGSSPAVVLAATAMGGSWDRDGCRPGAEQAAGCHGLLRSLEREHPEVTAIVVDVDDARPASELAEQLVGEYLAADEREVGYRDGRRWTLRPVAAELTNRPANGREWKPAAGWVVVATGGMRGITAEICDELAAPGVRFVLIGRTARASDPAVDAERRRTVERLLAAGAEVEPLVVDVGDDAAFSAAIDGIYQRHGRIDAVLHGAGAINDKRFELKTLEDFDRAFRAKVGGALTLSRHLRAEGLQWVVLFGSVSGRFGNPGQTDYAAANEVLNRLAWSLHRQWPGTRVMTINWGPWRSVGMAGDATLALLKARGIQAIDPPAGRRFLVDELRAGALDDVEIIAGAGPWAEPEARSASRLRSTLRA